MAQQQAGQLKKLLEEVIGLHLTPEAYGWLKEKASVAAAFSAVFVSIPRKTGKKIIQLTEEQDKNIKAARPGLEISGWTIDRLARVWLLLNLDATAKDGYFKTIENLFPAAEVNEQIALYAALPVLDYPEIWVGRCAEGIRSNIGDVLLAIMCNNPYPSENLGEAAWNQMVLKAFFTEKPIREITGIDKRANERLAKTLSDYAHERWAAHRSVNPQLWRGIGKFMNQELFADIEKLSASEKETEKQAAALACHDSNYPPAKELLSRNKNFQSAIFSGELTWNTLAEKT